MAHSQNQIVGNAPKIKNGTEISMSRVLPKFSDTGINKITTTVKDHYFYFPKDMEHTELYFFEILGEYNSFLLDKGRAEITIPDQSIKESSIKKSISEMDFQRYSETTKSNDRQVYRKATRALDSFLNSKSKDLIVRDKLINNVDRAKKKFEETKAKSDMLWFTQNKTSTINSYILESLIGTIPDHELAELFSTIPDSLKGNSWGKKVQYYFDNLAIGGSAPLFKQSDTSGKQVNLSDFRGKYVLLDFWASWCVPCRAESPNLIAAKAAFSDKDFAIVSVSLDEANKRDAWLKAIVEDKMDWVNLSTLAGFKNEAALKYHIRFIPSNFLIDPKGKIVGKNLMGKELLIKLNELIKQ